jgi:hypothetical protein
LLKEKRYGSHTLTKGRKLSFRIAFSPLANSKKRLDFHNYEAGLGLLTLRVLSNELEKVS